MIRYSEVRQADSGFAENEKNGGREKANGKTEQKASAETEELLETLRQYLYCNGNLVKTSQALFIHRNTLLYRLNQIRDLLGRDIDDALVRLELLSSIVAKDYLGE